MSMTEPQMRADIVAQVQAMAEPVEQAAPAAAAEPVEAQAEVVEGADEATSDTAADVVNDDITPDSQDQGVDGVKGRPKAKMRVTKPHRQSMPLSSGRKRRRITSRRYLLRLSGFLLSRTRRRRRQSAPNSKRLRRLARPLKLRLRPCLRSLPR